MKKFGIIYIGDVNYAYCIVNDSKLDLINTRIIDYIYKNYAKNTFKKYTNNILEFLNFIANEYFDLMSCMPDVIRAKITYFLSNKYHAKIIKRLNLEVIHIENNKKSNISTILAALKLYFEISISLKFYKHKNPISNDISYNKKIKDNRIPLMPINSGIRTPDEEKNIIKNHFIINEKKWIPDIIHDINLASKIFKIIQCSNWKLRDLIITRLMFESGARISEICGLTIDDWRDTEFKNGATIFNKGSYLVRTKYLQWSADTTKLLYKYFNEDRKYITKKH